MKNLMTRLQRFGDSMNEVVRKAIFLWSIFTISIGLRVLHFLLNRSLWLDEAMLANNIIFKDYRELFGQLEYSQLAPIGYLLLSKVLVELFGSHEYVLRFLSLLSGIGGLFLFLGIARRFFSEEYARLIFLVYSLTYPLIYFSSEVKQYSMDVFVSLLLFSIFLEILEDEELFRGWLMVLVVIGTLSPWFSLPSVFTIAGGCSFVILFDLWNGQKKRAFFFIGCSLLFFMSFYSHFDIVRGNIPVVGYQSYWQSHLAPVSWAFFSWVWDKLTLLFHYPVGILWPVAMVFFLAGLINSWLVSGARFFLLVSPLLFTLGASILQFYPIKGRVILFLVPYFVIFIGFGFLFFTMKIKLFQRWLTILILGLLLAQPLAYNGYRLIRPYFKEHIRPVISYLKDNFVEGDVIYIYHSGCPAFRYYYSYLDFPPDIAIVEGIYEPRDIYLYGEDLKKIAGYNRVWFLYSHNFTWFWNDEVTLFLDQLCEMGVMLEKYDHNDTGLYLFSLQSGPSIAMLNR